MYTKRFICILLALSLLFPLLIAHAQEGPDGAGTEVIVDEEIVTEQDPVVDLLNGSYSVVCTSSIYNSGVLVYRLKTKTTAEWNNNDQVRILSNIKTYEYKRGGWIISLLGPYPHPKYWIWTSGTADVVRQIQILNTFRDYFHQIVVYGWNRGSFICRTYRI